MPTQGWLVTNPTLIMDVVFDKMDPELKARFLEALRSGTYTKGEGDLKWVPKPDFFELYKLDTPECTHCTMGVLVDLKFPDKWVNQYSRWQGCTMYIPNLTLDDIGLTDNQRSQIVALNDWKRYTRQELLAADLGIPAEFIDKIDPEGTLKNTTFEHLAEFIETYF